MSGAIALHGGAEFLPGDEAFLRSLLEVAPRGDDGAIRAVVIPVAAARGRPALAASVGVGALRRVGADVGVPVEAEAVMVVDAASADDPALAARIAAADLVHLPGGDPDLVPGVLAGSRAWTAVLEAHARGAVIAGASAGAMGLAALTWTPRGFVPGLGLVEGFVVVPHYAQFDVRGREAEAERVRRDGLGVLGLDERTGAIRTADGTWQVAGEGRAVWMPVDGPAVTGRHGDDLPVESHGS
jgi:cyanophycinase-like exopeptidase